MAELQQLAPHQLKYPILKAGYGCPTFKGLSVASEKSLPRDAFTALNFQKVIITLGDHYQLFLELSSWDSYGNVSKSYFWHRSQILKP
jgi:hypothetical protein